MKKLLLSLLILFSLAGLAQVNLVVNPSFEMYTACPDNTGGDVYKATGWDTCRGTPDYFNTCASFTYFQIPKNLLGYQYPAYGNAYCGFYTHDGSSFYRELIIGQLSSPLIPTQKYYVSFKVSRADSNYVIGYSTNKLGVKMSMTKQNNVPVNNSATFYSDTVITDTVGWTRLNGSFISDSAYQYIMLGNFFDDANITIIHDGNGNIAYYYVDEVCLSTDSVFASNYSTDIVDYQTENTVNLFPNPAGNYFVMSGIENSSAKIFNYQGLPIEYNLPLNSKAVLIECSKWPEGIYFVQSRNRLHKLIINH